MEPRSGRWNPSFDLRIAELGSARRPAPRQSSHRRNDRSTCAGRVPRCRRPRDVSERKAGPFERLQAASRRATLHRCCPPPRGDERLSTTDPNLFAGTEFDTFERVRRQCRLTRFGLDALAYARIATGDIDVVIENGLKPHDYDALVAVVRGAGGHIGDWNGGDEFSDGRIVAAASHELYERAVGLIEA